MSTTRRPKDSKRTQVQALLDRGLVRFALGRRDEAIRLWQEAVELAPGNSRGLDYLQSVGAIPVGSLEIPPASADNHGITGEGEPLMLDKPEDMQAPFTQEAPSVHDEDAPIEDQGPVVGDVDILMRQARDQKAAGKLESAHKTCEDLLKRAPEHPEGSRMVAELRKSLTAVYQKGLEPLERVPVLRATDASILELSLDPIGGFLISQIDGEISLEELLTILGTFDQFRVLSCLHFFLESGIIELRPGR